MVGDGIQRKQQSQQRQALDETRLEACSSCGGELVTIKMSVDGNDLIMESCQRCDERRWHLAGSEIDLEEALAQVGEHAGRRR